MRDGRMNKMKLRKSERSKKRNRIKKKKRK